MHYLIVSATIDEIKPLVNHLSLSASQPTQIGEHKISYIITGVGLPNMCVNTFDFLMRTKVDCAINLGICGGSKDFDVLDLVRITHDKLLDLGAEDDQSFISSRELGLIEESELLGFEQVEPTLSEQLNALKIAQGGTVNTTTGSNETAEFRYPDLEWCETQEGQGFFKVCNKMHLPCYQIRAISNHIEKRDRTAWKVEEAITRLNQYMINLITEKLK